MTLELDTSRWAPAGATSNTRYFEIEPRVLGAVPHPGSVDDGRSAAENVALQNEHWRKAGHSGVVVVFADNLTSQDKDARRVYQTGPDPTCILGTALVGGTLLSRAIISFFLGIARPQIPVKMAPTLEDALGWAHQLIAAAPPGAPKERP